MRKRPDMIDIFDMDDNQDHSQMRDEFKALVRHEWHNLKTMLPEGVALDIINENYSYVDIGDYGKMTLMQFSELAKLILPKSMLSVSKLENIFCTYTGIG